MTGGDEFTLEQLGLSSDAQAGRLCVPESQDLCGPAAKR